MALSIAYNEEKNQLLKLTRNVSFEDVIAALANGRLLADIKHTTQKYSHQRIYVIKIGKYAYVVPYVLNEKKQEIFLKTIYPSRVFTKQFMGRKRDEKTAKK